MMVGHWQKAPDRLLTHAEIDARLYRHLYYLLLFAIVLFTAINS